MENFTIPLAKLSERVNMEVVYTPCELSRINVEIAEVNRPGLFLAGYYEYFDNLRLQIMGLAEMNFLSVQTPERRYEALDHLFGQMPPAVIVSRSDELTPFPEMVELAQKYKVALLRSNEATCVLMGSLLSVLNMELAPRITRHGVLVEVYGAGAVKVTETVDLVVQLEPWDPKKNYQRTGLETEYYDILGVRIPSTEIPVSPGRNLAVVLETAAINNRQKKMGYNAAKELLIRLGLDATID